MKSEQQDCDEVRAIVYHLNKATSEWQQLDTGLLKFQNDCDAEGVVIGHSIIVTKIMSAHIVKNDLEPPPTILRTRLLQQKMYVREQGTIIYWNEIQLNQQIAVTFSDKKTCDKLWKYLCSFIGKNPFEVGTLPSPNQVQMPHENNLPKLLVSVAQKQEAISYYIINKTKFLSDLLEVCKKILVKNKLEDIRLMYRILSGIIDYNDSRIIQILFASSSFPIVLGIYNKCSCPQINYSLLLQERFQLVNLIQLDEEIIEKIKISHYIIFFKDVILASKAEIPLQAALELSIKQCNMDIYNYITSEIMMQQLNAKILSSQLPQVLDFIFQQLVFAKQFNQDIKNKLVEKLYSQRLVYSLTQVISNKESFKTLTPRSQLRMIEVLSKISFFNQKFFTEFLKLHPTLLESLAYFFHNYYEDISDAIMQLLRNLIVVGIDKKRALDLIISGFFVRQAIHIRQSYVNGLLWSKQIQKMIDLMIVAVQSAEEVKVVCRLLDILAKYNLFHLLIQPPFTKIQKLKRLKLASIAAASYHLPQMFTIQQTLIQSKYFRTAVMWLNQSYMRNNIIESAVMNLLQIVSCSQKFILMEEIEFLQDQLPSNKIISQIVAKVTDLKQQASIELQKHHQVLQNQVEERYLNQDSDFPQIRKSSSSQPKEQIEQNLKLLTVQLEKKESIQQSVVKLPIQKSNIQFTFQFSTFDES